MSIQLHLSSLYQTCLNYICNNLDQLCDQEFYDHKNGRSNTKKYLFKNKTIKFNHIISEDLLERLCDLEKLNDSTLSIFSNEQTTLKKFHIKNSYLSKETLKIILKQHQINDLTVNNIIIDINLIQTNQSFNNFNPSINTTTNNNNNNINNNSLIQINDLIDCLNESSLESVKCLNVSRNISLFTSVLINLNKLKNLTKLNVSYTCFNNYSLDLISHDISNLEYLDISGTKVNDLSPLLNIKNKLKHLYMYNMRASLSDDLIKVIINLNKLQCLDLSNDVSTKIFADITLSLFDVNLLLDELASICLPDLVYFDISGKLSIKQETLIRFLNSYPSLKFIGLALTNANSFDIFQNENKIRYSYSSPSLNKLDQQTILIKKYFNLIITGESNESQLISSLKHYKTRHIYIQKALYHLYMLTRTYNETRVDLLLNVIDLMQVHSKSQSVQLAASTCVFNLTRNNLYKDIPFNVLCQIINCILITMLNFPNCLILQKNCLLILCNEGMLNSCIFNKFDCVKATLDCLINYTDHNIVHSSIAICSQVAVNAENKYRKQFKKLTDPKYLQKLISIISLTIRNLPIFVDDESIVHSVLDIICSLSEDNVEWCLNFITQNGLNIYTDLISTFENDLDILFKSMCFIYRLSEIGEIRPVLFRHQIMQNIKTLFDHNDINITFLVMGIISNFLAYMPESIWDWNYLKFDGLKYDLKLRMEYIIKNWNPDLNLLIEFKHLSFDSLIKLTKISNEPLVQMWSLWAIYNLYKFNSENKNIKLKALIEKLVNDKNTLPLINKLCFHISESI